MIIVSACLAGAACRHDGRAKEDTRIKNLAAKGLAMPLCPEVMGGRTVPRTPCEIKNGTGADVLEKKASVVDRDGNDVTAEVVEGAMQVVAAAKRLIVTAAILKTKSPACGRGLIYDGTFTGKLVEGNGVLAEALIREGIKVYTEEDCGETV